MQGKHLTFFLPKSIQIQTYIFINPIKLELFAFFKLCFFMTFVKEMTILQTAIIVVFIIFLIVGKLEGGKIGGPVVIVVINCSPNCCVETYGASIIVV